MLVLFRLCAPKLVCVRGLESVPKKCLTRPSTQPSRHHRTIHFFFIAFSLYPSLSLSLSLSLFSCMQTVHRTRTPLSRPHVCVRAGRHGCRFSHT